MKTYAEQVEDLETTRAARVARQEAVAKKAMDEGRSMEEAEQDEFDDIEKELDQIDADLVRYRKLAERSASTARPIGADKGAVDHHLKGIAPTIFVKKQDPDDKFEGQSFTRICIAKALAREHSVSPALVAEKRWGKTHPKLVEFIKADVGGFGGDTGEPGAELVVQDSYMGDFINYLYGMTVYDKLPLRTVPANVKIGQQDGASTGYWVGESKAINVTSADFNTVNLSYLKVAAIATASKEWLKHSSWDAEMLVRDSLAQAAAQRIDTTFISNTAAAAGVSPAGILNNIAATTSAGTDGDSVANDVKELFYRFTQAKNSGGQYFVMNPALATGLSLMRNALDQYEFPTVSESGGTLFGRPVVTGDNVNANYLILLKPSDIYRIGMESMEVTMSDVASIEMDSAPAADTDTPTAPTGKQVSMFQTESVAFKVVMPINFARRRESAVAWISDADYGGAIST